jgi:uncharacterized protein (DUF2336 family)
VNHEPYTELDARVFDSVLLQGGAEARKELGRQIAALLRDPDQRPGDREAVVPTLLKLAGDPVFEVRQFLAQQVLGFDDLDTGVMFTIIADDDEIALPFIAGSAALDAAAMLAVLKVGDRQRQIAIAQRFDIAPRCVALIIANAEWQVVAALLDNHAWEPTGDEYRRIFARLGAHPEIIERLLSRPRLPLEIRILEARRAAGSIHRFLGRTGLAPDREPDEAIAQAEDEAMLRVMASAQEGEVDRVLPILIEKKLLTPMLLLKAAAVGAMTIVDRILAQLAGMPLRRTQALIYRRNAGSLKAVFNRCSLPRSCLTLLRAAVEVERASRAKRQSLSSDDFGVRVVETLMILFADMGSVERSRQLDLIARLATEKARTVAEKLKEIPQAA